MSEIAIGSRDAASGPPFVLHCVVDRVRASSLRQIEPDSSTAVLRVELVLRAPTALGDLTGSMVTVALRDGVRRGQRIVLFADGWMYGESIALREVRRTDVQGVEQLRDELRRQEQDGPVVDLRERIRSAEVVFHGVVGELRSVRPRGAWIPRGEHDPDWWTAVIDVKDVARGTPGRRQRVLFANSDDVQWFQTPKLRPGQEAVFLLHAETRFGAPKGALVVLDPADVQPREQFDDIRRLIESERG